MQEEQEKIYPKNSMELNADLGEAILNAYENARVDVHNPQVLLSVEVRDTCINVYSVSIPGAGGMPVGTAERQCFCCQAELIHQLQAI